MNKNMNAYHFKHQHPLIDKLAGSEYVLTFGYTNDIIAEEKLYHEMSDEIDRDYDDYCNILSQINNRFSQIDEECEKYGEYDVWYILLTIIRRSEEVISKIPYEYLKLLNIQEGILLNSHGTITIEWRIDNNVISIEIGLTTMNWYAMIDNEIYKTENLIEIDIKNLKQIFQKYAKQ
jgi:hypothetical protein